MKEKRSLPPALSILAAVLNAVAAALIVKSVVYFFFFVGDGNMSVLGAKCFIYFTIDSNILAALSCIAAIPFNIKSAVTKKDELPLPLKIFKYVGACAVAVTFFTVMLFLGPTLGYPLMFEGNNLWLHLVCPLLAMAVLPFCERAGKLPFFSTFLSLAPVAVYGAVYMIMVIGVGKERGGWDDFYGFNIGGMWYLSFLVMLTATYLLGLGLYALCRLGGGEKKRAPRKNDLSDAPGAGEEDAAGRE